MDAVVARDLFRVYSTPEGDAAALQGLTLNVAEGEVVAVLGPSGAGKTTLLRLLAAVDEASAGELRVFGLDLRRLQARARGRYRRRTIGYVEQRYLAALDPALTVRDSVALRLRADGAADARARADELLDRVGLAERGLAYPRQLSGGEQQRVAVCAAVAHQPRLLLADEPTGELDRAAADATFELIRELAGDTGATAIVVTHDPAASAYADRTVRIRDGRVSEERHGGAEQIIVARGGWIRLPEELLQAAGVRDRVGARLRDGEIVVAAPGDAPPVPSPAAPPAVEPTSPASESVVAELRAVSKRYGTRRVLEEIDAQAWRGVLTAITGPSGSGKTTLVDVLLGLEQPDSGDVAILGRSVTRADRDGRAAIRRAHVGYVAQQPALAGFLTARENIELGLRLRGREGNAVRALVDVGLADRVEQRVERLSSGERLRVAIARALAARPDLLVADEPTARLDEPNARRIASLLARLAREWGAAVVVATHDATVAEQADERIELA